MNNTTYKVLKLISGENIICEMTPTLDGAGGDYEISHPLLMRVVPKFHEKGMTESLGLTRWVQPFTKQTFFSISKEHVLLSCDAAPDLAKYYEFVMNKYEDDILGQTIEPTDEITEEQFAEGLEDIDDDEEITIH
tara:strand:+ start:148 stop:552 length:405 start_codon:yes stop_codon:yes gene_type:complete